MTGGLSASQGDVRSAAIENFGQEIDQGCIRGRVNRRRGYRNLQLVPKRAANLVPRSTRLKFDRKEDAV
jgi:hypothetical protein